ncbi:hypothetical protein [Methanoregula sp.]|uniref:hypothetical protein n=1 Tax=Methanoregula sp. TaxID=2052170 RepID=UPI003BAF83E1
MDKKVLIDTLGWGLLLWFIGYVLGIILFFVLPLSLIGWAILPVGIIIMFWVLFKQINSEYFRYYLMVAVVWTVIATLCDYVFIVLLLKPEIYYKPDVYIYYLLMFAIPLIAFWWKKHGKPSI